MNDHSESKYPFTIGKNQVKKPKIKRIIMTTTGEKPGSWCYSTNPGI